MGVLAACPRRPVRRAVTADVSACLSTDQSGLRSEGADGTSRHSTVPRLCSLGTVSAVPRLHVSVQSQLCRDCMTRHGMRCNTLGVPSVSKLGMTGNETHTETTHASEWVSFHSVQGPRSLPGLSWASFQLWGHLALCNAATSWRPPMQPLRPEMNPHDQPRAWHRTVTHYGHPC